MAAGKVNGMAVARSGRGGGTTLGSLGLGSGGWFEKGKVGGPQRVMRPGFLLKQLEEAGAGGGEPREVGAGRARREWTLADRLPDLRRAL